jgi:heme-degrading monooxygenase HmoA
MIVVANRISVAKGFEKAFEERFKNRARKVDKMSGFIRNEVLRPVGAGFYVVLTHWESKESFEAWTESDEFKEAHKSRPPSDMFSGASVFEMHEVIECSESEEKRNRV